VTAKTTQMTVGCIRSNMTPPPAGIMEMLLEQKERQVTKLRDALSEIAEDCGGWLNGEIEEPSLEFIKAVKKYAEKALLEQ